ncbi:MAG: enoyl-CoA hydratase [Candidatus Hydrogenedentota bacterium]
MNYEEILFDVSDRIATITLNRPAKLNAWTLRMEAEYRHAMAQAESRDDVRVIIVTGEGKGFCAGADFGLLTAVMNQNLDMNQDAVPHTDPGTTNPRPDFKKTYSYPCGIGKPIIAAVNGPAMGIGLVHTLYCDIRFASDTARFGTAFAARGLIAEHGISWLLPRLVGMQHAFDLLYTARIFDATEAHRIGLVKDVFPADTFMQQVRDYATLLATKSSPRSLAIIKRELWDAQFADLGSSVDIAVNDMFESFGSDDFREGIASFMEKRNPEFTGK